MIYIVIIDASEFKKPAEKPIGKAEMQAAKQLISSMTSPWKPEQYTDDYREALEKMIDEKIERGEKELAAPAKKKRPANIIDLASQLEQSIQQARGKRRVEKPATKARSRSRKKAA